MKTLLSKTKKSATLNKCDEVVDAIASSVISSANSNEKLGMMAIATESLNETDTQLLDNRANDIQTVLKAAMDNLDVKSSPIALECATVAGILATSPRAFLTQSLTGVNGVSNTVNAGVADNFGDRPLSLEAYDERENRNAQVYSIAYNLLAMNQDAFGETLFPILAINPTEVGLLISNKLFYVYNDFKRSVTGALANYGRVSLIRAYADHEILKNEQTRAIPVLRAGGGADDNSDKFAPVAEVPARTVNLGSGLSVTTTAVRVDTRIDAIGISQTNELLNSGLMGPSDNLDAYAKALAVYLRVVDANDKVDVIKIDVDHLPSALYTYAVQGNSRRMVLNLDSDGIVLPIGTTKANGDALEVLTELATHEARIHVSFSGSVYLDKGEANATRGVASLVALVSSTGAVVGGATRAGLEAKLKSAEIVYYDYDMLRANSNVRQRCQLLESQTEFSVIQVPYRSPVSAIAPVAIATSGAPDGSVVQDLVTTTGIRQHNEAVTTLFKVASVLDGYRAVPDATGRLPEMAYMGHYYVIPTFFKKDIALPAAVDSRASHERLKDIRASLIEQVRYYANEMFRASEYQAGAQLLTGNVGFRPTVVVATDPVLANYMNSDGEFRSLGEQFDVKVVSSIDKRMKGQIFITFTVFDANRNTTVNPLSSGNLLVAPEIVTQLPITRDGATSHEAIVTPRFLHIWNLPVMTKLSVTGLVDTVGKVAVHYKEV